MNWKLKLVAASVGIVLIGYAVNSVYSVYEENKDLTGANQSLTTQLSEQAAINAKQQENIQALHKLEAKHTQELAHAKSEIDTLRADVAAGRRKLHIKATCPVSETTSSGGVVNAATPQFTEPAKQDYYDLLRMMMENGQQTQCLQDYIRTECLR
jgi:prophage endopeptidase